MAGLGGLKNPNQSVRVCAVSFPVGLTRVVWTDCSGSMLLLLRPRLVSPALRAAVAAQRLKAGEVSVGAGGRLQRCADQS
ncbi:hypothetical protein CRENBAI_001260, partial [Crenichthys baileyi]